MKRGRKKYTDWDAVQQFWNENKLLKFVDVFNYFGLECHCSAARNNLKPPISKTEYAHIIKQFWAGNSWLTAQQVADFFGVTKWTVHYNIRRAGGL